MWIVQLVTALGFLGAAIQKFEAAPSVMRTFDAMGWSTPPRIVLGVLEVVGAVALFVPVLAGVAASGFVALTICASVVQVSTGESVVAPLIMLALTALTAWGRRDSIISLRSTLTTRPNAGMS
ncbi:hypothetical protein GCM10011492_42190 [Flexivirga endophytica]|uniref:DoxX family protein n=2 Tax=Flexivirga endophytica TaxID=1849103 RepID=A0A916X107_9MICO|nr:hypothetical protein GCM10011492_42190 [Flexivirga endophytica]GHB70691.1 hypothetical protein GCM10008112_43900 [Flexivirga endophytica]